MAAPAAPPKAKGRAGAKTAQDEAARQKFEKEHPRAAKGRSGGGAWIGKGQGMDGEPDSRVRQLQNRLSSLGYNLVADGRFGPATDVAVRAFQRDRGLKEDGKVGDATTGALRTDHPSEGKPDGGGAAAASASSGAYGAKYAGDSPEARKARGDQNEQLAGQRDVGTKTKAQKKAAKDAKRSRSKAGGGAPVADTGAVVDGGSIDGQGSGGSSDKRARRSSSTDTVALGLGMDRQRGDKRVSDLQTMLDDIGMNLGAGGTDGKFGPDTKRALMRFQRKYGLKADGVFGRRTRIALNTAQKLASARERNRPGSSLSELADDRKVVTLVLQEADTKHDYPTTGDKPDAKGEGMKRCPSCEWRNAKGKTKCAHCGADLAKKGDAKLAEQLAEAVAARLEAERTGGDINGTLAVERLLRADLAEAGTNPEPFSRSKTSNWVARAGGLPTYIQHVAHDIMEGDPAKTESQAIAIAISQAKKNAAKGNKQAAAAVAQWERMKGKAKVSEAALAEALERIERGADPNSSAG